MAVPKIDPELVIFVVQKYHNDIIGFAKDILKADLDGWQIQFLQHCQKDPRVAVRAGNSVGKSFAVGCLAIWHLITKPGALVVLVANSEAQVKDRTMRTCADILNNSHIKDWFDATATKIALVTDPTVYITIAVGSKSNPDAIRGFHARNYLLIVDEAQGIDPTIFQALETTVASNDSKMVMIGNPTKTGTNFHLAFTDNAKYWTTMKVDGRYCKHVNQEWVKKTIDEHGIDSDYVRMTILGEFPLESNNQFIDPQILKDCASYQVPEAVWSTFPVVLGVDVARGGTDNSVICVKQGRKIHEFIKLQVNDHFVLAERVNEVFQRYNARTVVVDETGLGSGTVDILRNSFLKPHQVIGKNFATKSSDPTKYANTRQELWIEGKQKLKSGLSIDSRSVLQLIQETKEIEFTHDAKGRITVESKEDMRRKGIDSPDMTDALFLALSLDAAPTPPPPPKDPDWAFNLGYSSRRPGGSSSWMSV